MTPADAARLRRALGRYLSARLVERVLADLRAGPTAHRDPVVVASEAAADAEPSEMDIARGRRLLREARRRGR